MNELIKSLDLSPAVDSSLESFYDSCFGISDPYGEADFGRSVRSLALDTEGGC